MIRKIQAAKNTLPLSRRIWRNKRDCHPWRCHWRIIRSLWRHDDDDDQVQHLLKQDDNTYIVSTDLLVEELADTLELGKVPETTYPWAAFCMVWLKNCHTKVKWSITKFYLRKWQWRTDCGNPTYRFTLLSVVERRIIKARLEIIGSKIRKNQDTKNRIKGESFVTAFLIFKEMEEAMKTVLKIKLIVRPLRLQPARFTKCSWKTLYTIRWKWLPETSPARQHHVKGAALRIIKDGMKLTAVFPMPRSTNSQSLPKS